MHNFYLSGTPLLKLETGRIFCRTNKEGTGFVGVVEMPADLSVESLRQFRLNSHIRVDKSSARLPAMDNSYILGEYSANELLTNMKFRQYTLPDALECFVRHSFLPHPDPTLAWNIILSATRTPLSSMPTDGLYEFKNETCVLVSNHAYNGNTIGSVLGEPLWGPDGQYALTSSMEMETYKNWIVQEQEANMKRDPAYRAFVQAMSALGELPMYMNKQQLAIREEHANLAIVSAQVFPAP